MGKATFKCNECNKEKVISFESGKKPECPICEKCNKPMKRQFKNVEIGDVVDDMMIHYGQSTLYS